MSKFTLGYNLRKALENYLMALTEKVKLEQELVKVQIEVTKKSNGAIDDALQEFARTKGNL